MKIENNYEKLIFIFFIMSLLIEIIIQIKNNLKNAHINFISVMQMGCTFQIILKKFKRNIKFLLLRALTKYIFSVYFIDRILIFVRLTIVISNLHTLYSSIVEVF